MKAGGSAPCLFVIYKGDEEATEETFVSISGKIHAKAKAHSGGNAALILYVFLSFDLRDDEESLSSECAE